MKRIKILARKNLQMTEGKLAAQSVHAALGLALFDQIHQAIDLMSVIVLQVSDKKFQEAKESHLQDAYVVRDRGYTEVQPGTETCMAFFEDDPRENNAAGSTCCIHLKNPFECEVCFPRD